MLVDHCMLLLVLLAGILPGLAGQTLYIDLNEPSQEEADMKLMELQQDEIQRLLAYLAICDNDHFNIDNIPIPPDWSSQSRALLELASMRHMIEEEDLIRYERIVRNCNAIGERVAKLAAREQAAGPKSPRGGKGQGKLTREQVVKLRAVQQRVEKLFEVLSICDDPNFDIRKIKIPESWSAKKMAIMALASTMRKKLIRKDDQDRYRRIMKNCEMISKKVEEAADRSASLESKTSGMSLEAIEEIKRLIRQSDPDDLSNRFADLTIGHHQPINSQKTINQAPQELPPPEPRPWLQSSPIANTRTIRPITIEPLESAGMIHEKEPVLHHFII